MRGSVALFALLLPIVACTQAPEPAGPTAEQAAAAAEADRQAIRATNDAWDAAYTGGNLDALMALYTDDAISLPNNGPALVGKAAIRAQFQSEFEQAATEGTGTVDEVRLAGDWAFVRGTFSSTVTPKGGEPIHEKGKWAGVLDRQPDGSWKFSREIWNTDRPATATP